MNFKQEEEEPIQAKVGSGFVLCTGGAKGTDQLAEELGLQFGVQVEVVIPPGHSRSRTITPLSPGVLTLAGQSAHRRGGRETRQTGAHLFLHSSIDTAQLRNRSGGLTSCTLLIYWKTTADEMKGVQGGLCNWLWIKAKSLSV